MSTTAKSWECFASGDVLRRVVVERMLAGVATRRHLDVTEPVGVGQGDLEVGGVSPVQGGH